VATSSTSPVSNESAWSNPMEGSMRRRSTMTRGRDGWSRQASPYCGPGTRRFSRTGKEFWK
jgi:hypothetical protein